MKALIGTAVLLLGFVWARSQVSQSFTTLRFHEQHGLAATDVFGIAQDSSGYIWMGTDAGVFRFDGSRFEHVSTQEQMRSRLITRIIPAGQNGMLLLGERPMDVYQWKGGNIRILEGNLWNHLTRWYSSGSPKQEQVYLMDYQRKQAHLFTPELEWKLYSLPCNPIKVTQVNDHLYAFYGGEGYYQWIDTAFEHRYMPQAPKEQILLITQDDQGMLWALGEVHLFQWKQGEWSLVQAHKLETLTREVHHTVWDQEGRLWIGGTHNGLFVLDVRSGSVKRVDQQLGIENAQVTYLFRDRDGHVWISTAGYGLICVLRTHFPKYTSGNGLNGNYITALHRSGQNRLFVGTNSGLNAVTLDERGFPEKVESIVKRGYVRNVTTDPGGQVVFVHAGRLVEWNRDAAAGPTYYGLPGRMVYAMDSGCFVIGTWISSGEVNLSTEPVGYNMIRRFPIDDGGSGVSYAETQQGSYLLMAESLYRVGDAFTQLLPQSQEELGQVEYHALEVGPQEGLWVASSRGVFHSSNHSDWQCISRKDGLPSDRCLSLAFDSSGTLWVGTDQGLCRYDTSGVRTWTQASGLSGNRISKLIYDTVYHCLWVGTPDGLTQLFPEALRAIPVPTLSLYIKNLEVLGDTVIHRPDAPVLGASQNHVRIQFASIHYASPAEVEYQYRLQGAQTEWITTDQPVAEYVALAPGDYRFLARSRVLGASWGPEASLSFEVTAPWWSRWYVPLMAGILVAGGVFILARWRIRSIRRQETQKRQTLTTINSLEQQVLHSSMNPHFLFNALHSVQSRLSRHKDPEAINYVAEFAALIRLNMEAVRKKSISLADEVDQLMRYMRLESTRLKGRFRYELNVAKELETHTCEIPSMLVQPFVENAIWHGIAPLGREGLLTVDFRPDSSGLLQVTVEDNGVGLSENQRKAEGHISRGIQLTRERLHMLSPRNRLVIEERNEEEGCGTRVRLWLDIQ